MMMGTATPTPAPTPSFHLHRSSLRAALTAASIKYVIMPDWTVNCCDTSPQSSTPASGYEMLILCIRSRTAPALTSSDDVFGANLVGKESRISKGLNTKDGSIVSAAREAG